MQHKRFLISLVQHLLVILLQTDPQCVAFMHNGDFCQTGLFLITNLPSLCTMPDDEVGSDENYRQIVMRGLVWVCILILELGRAKVLYQALR